MLMKVQPQPPSLFTGYHSNNNLCACVELSDHSASLYSVGDTVCSSKLYISSVFSSYCYILLFFINY